jgi:hypothetical protein
MVAEALVVIIITYAFVWVLVTCGDLKQKSKDLERRIEILERTR